MCSWTQSITKSESTGNNQWNQLWRTNTLQGFQLHNISASTRQGCKFGIGVGVESLKESKKLRPWSRSRELGSKKLRPRSRARESESEKIETLKSESGVGVGKTGKPTLELGIGVKKPKAPVSELEAWADKTATPDSESGDGVEKTETPESEILRPRSQSWEL